MTDRLRVLLVIAGLPAGGAERQMALLARGLNRDRVAPGLLIFNREEKIHYREALEGDIWFRTLGLTGRSPWRLVPAVLRGLQEAADEFQPNIIHTSLNVANHLVRATALARGWKTPIITSVRNDFRMGYQLRERIAEQMLWRRSTAITCNNYRVKQQLISELGTPPNRVTVIPNAIDDRFFTETPGAPPDWWPPHEVALFIGRFTPQKNPVGLIRAFGDLLAQNPRAGWTLILVGEGPLEREMRQEIDARSLAHRILIRPPQSDIVGLYRACEVLVLPSLFEGMPNVCLEAAASGCPVAVTPTARVEALLAAGGGWLIRPDLPEMAGDLVNVFKKTAQERQTAGRRGREYAKHNHTIGCMVDATTELYDKLSGGVKN